MILVSTCENGFLMVDFCYQCLSSCWYRMEREGLKRWVLVVVSWVVTARRKMDCRERVVRYSVERVWLKYVLYLVSWSKSLFHVKHHLCYLSMKFGFFSLKHLLLFTPFEILLEWQQRKWGGLETSSTNTLVARVRMGDQDLSFLSWSKQMRGCAG
jgi:hypothetical protein